MSRYSRREAAIRARAFAAGRRSVLENHRITVTHKGKVVRTGTIQAFFSIGYLRGPFHSAEETRVEIDPFWA